MSQRRGQPQQKSARARPLPGRFPAADDRNAPRVVRSLYLFANSFLTIGLLALLAMLFGTPLVFPSLGPTAFMLFHDSQSKSSSARITILGHAIGIACGFAALWLTGLANAPPTMTEQLTPARVLCAAVALSSTGLLMNIANLWHPPAGATTLIVALGFITQPYHLLIMEAAVIALVVLAVGINRVAEMGRE